MLFFYFYSYNDLFHRLQGNPDVHRGRRRPAKGGIAQPRKNSPAREFILSERKELLKFLTRAIIKLILFALFCVGYDLVFGKDSKLFVVV